jgi:acylphosphatase
MSGVTGVVGGGPAGARHVRVRVVVTGRVQGVFFRDACRDQARIEGIGGWVRNRGDGAVEAEFEGPPDGVDRLVAWCRRGPARARVDALAVAPIPPIGDQRFRIV